jgi:hypothetical protein
MRGSAVPIARALCLSVALVLATAGSARADSVTGVVTTPAEEPVDPANPAAPDSATKGYGPGTPPEPRAEAGEDPTLRKTVSQRRNGVVVGVTPGIAFAGASGYPNNARLVGNPDYYSQSPLLVGSSTTYFLMGALTDYLSFGPMVNIARFTSDKWTSKGVGIGFRAEVFPLIALFPRLADTAIFGQAGVGSTELQAKGNFPSADGTQSFLGIGLHHEFRFFRALGGHISGGPYVEYDAIFSTSAERHWASVGFRLAFYGGAVTADKR